MRTLRKESVLQYFANTFGCQCWDEMWHKAIQVLQTHLNIDFLPKSSKVFKNISILRAIFSVCVHEFFSPYCVQVILFQIVCKENLKYEVTSPDTKGDPQNILPLEVDPVHFLQNHRQHNHYHDHNHHHHHCYHQHDHHDLMKEPRKRGCSAGKNFINVDRVFLLLRLLSPK